MEQQQTTRRRYAPGGNATYPPVEQVMTDAQGNNMYVINNGRSIDIYAQMKDDAERRYVGTVDLQLRVLTVKRKRAVHLHRQTQSYGFNHHIVSTGKTFDKVQIIDDRGTYMLPVTVILHEGKILNFVKQGFEKQIFVPLDVITSHKSKAII